MILTGKAAEYAESFEEFDRKVMETCQINLSELTEDEQISLFNITMMFERDEAFRNYIIGCFSLYAGSISVNKERLIKLLVLMEGVTKCLSQS